ncbi:MAG: hypothetical protein HRT57_06105 [Crocinitomicaceae bacterium]|nr:hypothetical protein [Crocinitomicaceae bacterium]
MMKGTRFYKLLILALVILNICTLAYFQLTKYTPPPRPNKQEISKTLELKGDAKSSVNALEKDHHNRKKTLVHRDHELHEKLFNRIGSGKPTHDLLNQIGKNKEEIESMTFIFFDEVAEHCNDRQKEKLIKFVQRRLNRLRPGPRPPRRR